MNWTRHHSSSKKYRMNETKYAFFLLCFTENIVQRHVTEYTMVVRDSERKKPQRQFRIVRLNWQNLTLVFFSLLFLLLCNFPREKEYQQGLDYFHLATIKVCLMKTIARWRYRTKETRFMTWHIKQWLLLNVCVRECMGWVDIVFFSTREKHLQIPVLLFPSCA